MEYNFSKDLKSIREILGISQSEFADQIGVEQITISRNELGRTNPSAKILENVYTFAFAKNIKINKLKEMFWRDDLKKHEKLLFHGAKSKIDGKIDIHRGRHNDDDLACKRYEVNQEGMMTIAYYRGALDEYKNHPVIKKL
ncbi:helix-turn-helix transcriptional regulator [Anaerobutyricum hallii]|uniref:helix-turn-helix transcriptional regulator n=1 Tax=Anaerobutyricum hallii TaxID=39488 RepID=UPI0024329EB8|nr:helix-turn-helix transcriptional regulator [Anaerobutyricum hallii]